MDKIELTDYKKRKDKLIENNKRISNQKGITLIALVITVVILIILATISINFVFGEDGLIRRAEQARDLYENKAKEEQELLNNIAKRKWVQTFAYGLENKIVSIDNMGEIYTVDVNKDGFFQLYGQDFEILTNSIIVSNTTGKYYKYNIDSTNLEELEYIKKIAVDNYNNVYEILYNDNIMVTDSELNERYLDEIFPEVEGKKWKDIKKIDTLISLEKSTLLLTSTNDERFIIQEDGVESHIYNFDELFPSLSDEEIKAIAPSMSSILTQSGKIFINDGDETLALPLDIKINNILLGIIEADNNEYYIMQEDENLSLKKLEEVYPELGNVNKVAMYEESVFIMNKNGELYIPDDSTNTFVNVKEYITELKDEKIIDIVVNFDRDMDTNSFYILTASGKAFKGSEDNISLIAENITQIKNKGNIITFVNKEGQEGFITDNGIKFLNSQIEQKISINLNNIKQMIQGLILTEDGEIYYLEEDNSLRKLNDEYFNGNKIIYMTYNVNSTIYVIDDLHNMYQIDKSNIFGNFVIDITNEHLDLKEKNVEQIEGSSSLAITEGGKLEAIYGTYFSDEAEKIVSNTSFSKISRGFVLDNEGNVYLGKAYNYDRDLIKINDKLDNKKIIDIEQNTFLSEDGNVYIYKDKEEAQEYINITNDPTCNLYHKKIVQISSTDGIVSCIDEEGNKYDNVFDDMIQRPE